MFIKFIKNLYYIIIPLLILGIPYRFTTFGIALAAFLPLLLLTNRHTVGLFFLMYGGPFGGVIRAVYPILPVYGLLFEVIGILLIWDILVELFRVHPKALVAIFFTLALFGVFYLMGPMDEWARNKYGTMCIHGISMVLGYFAFDQSHRIEPDSLTRILLVASICMFTYVIQSIHLIPGNLFDYNWFREQQLWEMFHSPDDYSLVISYQHIGMMILFSIAIYMSQIELEIKSSLFYMICAFQLVLMTGCRQAILGVVLVFALRFFVFRISNLTEKRIVSRSIGIIVSLTLFFIFIIALFNKLDSNIVSGTLREGDIGRVERWFAALTMFHQYPLLGGGLGRFHALTGYPWPHNFFLELLCETGFIGTITFLSILVISLINKKTKLLHITSSNLFYFLLVLGIFVRVMVSSDFRESIELFSAVFAISVINNHPLNEKNNTN